MWTAVKGRHDYRGGRWVLRLLLRTWNSLWDVSLHLCAQVSGYSDYKKVLTYQNKYMSSPQVRTDMHHGAARVVAEPCLRQSCESLWRALEKQNGCSTSPGQPEPDAESESADGIQLDLEVWLRNRAGAQHGWASGVACYQQTHAPAHTTILWQTWTCIREHLPRASLHYGTRDMQEGNLGVWVTGTKFYKRTHTDFESIILFIDLRLV